MKKIKETVMEYPFDPSGKNALYDGERHRIRINSMNSFKFGGNTYYITRYFDYNFNAECTTVLTKIGDTWAKVPLDNYDMLTYFENSNILEEINMNEIDFNSEIVLAEKISARVLFKFDKLNPNNPIFPPNREPYNMMASQNDPKIAFNIENPPNNNPQNNNFIYGSMSDEDIIIAEYIPINPNNKSIFLNDSFIFAGVSIDNENDFIYEKSPSYIEKTEKIKEAIENKKNNITLDVQPGTKGIIRVQRPDGSCYRKEVLLIPGRRIYHLNFQVVNSLDGFFSQHYAQQIVINSTHSKNSFEVYFMGCQGIYETSYFNPDKEQFTVSNGEVIPKNGLNVR